MLLSSSYWYRRHCLLKSFPKWLLIIKWQSYLSGWWKRPGWFWSSVFCVISQNQSSIDQWISGQVEQKATKVTRVVVVVAFLGLFIWSLGYIILGSVYSLAITDTTGWIPALGECIEGALSGVFHIFLQLILCLGKPARFKSSLLSCKWRWEGCCLRSQHLVRLMELEPGSVTAVPAVGTSILEYVR